MRVSVSTFVGTTFALGVGCIVTEAFLQPSLVPGNSAQTGTGIASAAAAGGAEVGAAGCSYSRRRRPSVGGRGRARRATIAAVGASSPLSDGDVEEKGQQGRTKPRASSSSSSSSSGGGGGKGLARRLSASVAAVAQLRQTAATTLAAVLIVASASTEQDIMTAMMGLDPSLVPAKSGAQSAMTLPKDEQGSGTSSSRTGELGSIDLTGQSTGAGEIPGGPGGGFRNGRLMVDESSDLAMMLGKKMKTPDAEPLTH